MKKIVEEYGKDNVVAVIGSPNGDSSELYAETLINGDPSWTGPLAGVALNLSVFHVLENVIKDQIDEKLYGEHLELMEIAMDVEGIITGLDRVRKG